MSSSVKSRRQFVGAAAVAPPASHLVERSVRPLKVDLMKKRFGALLISIAALASASAHSAEPMHWVASWGASPAPPPSQTPSSSSPSFEDRTIRQIVRLSAGGERVRIRFSNEFGSKPLHIEAAHLALAAKDDGEVAGTDHTLTFGGKTSVDIPPGAPMLSDPVDLALPPLSRLSISLYLPNETGPCTCHGVGLETAFVVPGNAADQATFQNPQTLGVRAFLTSVEVATSKPSASIIALGDSITDGVMSTSDADRRWPDRLAERLVGKPIGVVNEGISGNRLLAGGAGESALTRFDRDVLSNSGARYLIIFEGVNDLGLRHPVDATGAPTALPPTASDLIEAYRQLIERAHAHGLKVIGATIVPYEGAGYYSAQGETDRETINAWIKTSHAFDAVLDFDAVWRDPSHPTRIQALFDSGDHIHGSDMGYKALADAIDLRLFDKN